MNRPLPLTGNLADWDLPSILFHIHSQDLNGAIRIESTGVRRHIYIEEQTVTSVCDDEKGSNFQRFLCEQGHISKSAFQRIESEIKKNGLNPARAILDAGIMEADLIWPFGEEYQRFLLFSLFSLSRGQFEIIPGKENDPDTEISLENSLLELIIDGIRSIKDESALDRLLQNHKELLVIAPGKIPCYNLKTYERHVYRLVKRYSSLDKILKKSQLSSFLTLRTLYLLLTLQVISPPKSESLSFPQTEGEKNWIPAFNSFEEALAYFNNRYEYIYRLLSKEIGPVAASILHDSVYSIIDRLPPYLKNIRIEKTGKLEEKSILRALWYLNFEQTIADFLTGMEEILYAEIFAAKKHLGKEFEQVILQWLRENVEN